MDWEKQEKELNTLYNELFNIKADIKWCDAEIKLHKERSIATDAKFFFRFIDLYIRLRDYELFDAEMDKEYIQVNQ